MSARQEALEAFAGTDADRDSINRYFDDYAHELAEKIRKGYEGDGPDEDNWIMTPYDAATLIDPGVK